MDAPEVAPVTDMSNSTSLNYIRRPEPGLNTYPCLWGAFGHGTRSADGDFTAMMTSIVVFSFL
jgi:hypothetical protein